MKKRIGLCVLTLLFLLSLGTAVFAAEVTPPGSATGEVKAVRKEAYDENTHVASNENGVFTITLPSGITVTVTVPEGLPEGARLCIIDVSGYPDAAAWFSSLLSDEGEKHRPFDLFFTKDEKRIDVAGDITITMTLPEGYPKPQIYFVAGDGTAKRLKSAVQDGRISFQTDRNSFYVLNTAKEGGGGQEDPAKPPQTGDPGSDLYVLLLATGAASLILNVIRGKRQTKA